MAVQAQHPSIVHNNVLENFQELQYGVGGENQSINNSGMILFGRSNCNTNSDYGHHHQNLVLKGTVFSDLESELTCNVVSESKKRKHSTDIRSDDQMHHHLNPRQYYQHNYFPSSRSTKLLPKVSATVNCVQEKSVEENRLNQSGRASTSGRTSRYDDLHLDLDLDVDVSPQVSPLMQYCSQQFLVNSYHQNLDDEIDALIRLQHETLRLVVEQTQQRQCRLLLSVLEQQFLRRLTEKQIELENALSKNAELEQKVKQMNAETQMWFNLAKNNEAMVLNLRSSLEQQLLNLHHHRNNQNQKTITTGVGLEDAEEGFGDSSDEVADDAQSANNNNNCHQLQVNVGERENNKTVSINVDVGDDDHSRDDASVKQQHRNVCKMCKEKEVSVLLLPCRHLCLCKDCEAKLQTCPICNSFKNASLQIFMS